MTPSELAAKISLIRSGDIPCDHHEQAHDIMGSSCEVCLATLAGFGAWGRERRCRHVFEVELPGGKKMCAFCEAVQ